MSEKMVRTQVYLPREAYEQLKQRAEAEGITMATQIREALVQYIATPVMVEKGDVIPTNDPIWEMIGMGKSDLTDGAINHDDYIYDHDWDSTQEQK